MYWAKEARHNSVCTVWFNLYEIQQKAKEAILTESRSAVV